MEIKVFHDREPGSPSSQSNLLQLDCGDNRFAFLDRDSTGHLSRSMVTKIGNLNGNSHVLTVGREVAGRSAESARTIDSTRQRIR